MRFWFEIYHSFVLILFYAEFVEFFIIISSCSWLKIYAKAAPIAQENSAIHTTKKTILGIAERLELSNSDDDEVEVDDQDRREAPLEAQTGNEVVIFGFGVIGLVTVFFFFLI